MKILNLNTMCRVTLTVNGAQAYREHFKYTPMEFQPLKEPVQVGSVLTRPLWSLMRIFGSEMSAGLPVLFEGNKIEVEEGIKAIDSPDPLPIQL